MRWTQGWLSATASILPGQAYRGERLGRPRSGPGSVAGFGRRLGGIVVDWVPCAVLAQLFTRNPATSALVLFALLTVLSLALAGRTPGHAAFGLRVCRMDGGLPGFGQAAVRTVLLCLVVPAVVDNADGRGLHDRATDTLVVSTR